MTAAPRVFALMTEPRCISAVPFALQNAIERLSPYIRIVDIVEDAVFNNCTDGRDKASVKDAMAFVSYGGLTKCFDWEGRRQCPWGVQKPLVYTHGDYKELVEYCPEVVKLQRFFGFARHEKPKKTTRKVD